MKINFSDEEPIISKYSIFLAGPTLRNSSYDNSWRKEAVRILKEAKFDGVVYIPEYSKERFVETEETMTAEIEWEWETMESAGVVLFWVPRNNTSLPGFTTNIEFGRCITLRPESTVLGFPKNAVKTQYIDMLYTRLSGRSSTSTLAGTVLRAITLLDDINRIKKVV